MSGLDEGVLLLLPGRLRGLANFLSGPVVQAMIASIEGVSGPPPDSGLLRDGGLTGPGIGRQREVYAARRER